MDRSEGKKPQKQDVVDEAEYARALRATMHIRSPDRSRSGSAANFGPHTNEDEDLAKAINASLQYVPEDPAAIRQAHASGQEVFDLTEEEMMAMAMDESEKMARESAAAKESRTLPTASTSNGTTKKKRKIQEVVIVDDSDEEERPPPVRKDTTQHGSKSNANNSNGTSASNLPSTASNLSSTTTAPLPPADEAPTPTMTTSSSTSSTFLLDRAALEKERLERQKRLRGDVNAPASSSDDEEESQENEEAEVDQRDAKRRKVVSLSAVKDQASAVPPQAGPSTESHNHASSSRSAAKSGPELFLDGEVRPTWNRFADDERKRFKIENIIGDKEDLALVITASYCHESEWINRHFPDPSLVPTIHIRQPPSAAENDKWTMETPETGGGIPGSAAVWAFMPYPGFRGTMHMKFMLLFHKSGRLRVVIASANLVSYDWEDIENVVFVQDLQPNAAKPSDPTTVTEDMPAKFQRLFERNMKLEKPLKHLKQFHPFGSEIPLDVVRSGQRSLANLGKWDWSRVTAELVVSVPGKEIGEANVGRSGKGGLAACLRRRGWVPGSGQELVAEFQSSSLTNFTINFMWNFYDCMRGKTALATASASRPTKSKVFPPIKVVFPSLRTVMHSELGPPGAGTMFCRDAHWTQDTRDLFYDANCKAAKVMMHTKCILATFRSSGEAANSVQSRFARGGASGASNDTKSAVGGWYYIGSHNFSSAAWGTMSMSKPGSQPQINVTNYEMGIVLPLPADDPEKAATEFATWKRPPRKYDLNSDKPWMQDEFRALLERGPEAINADVSRYGM